MTRRLGARHAVGGAVALAVAAGLVVLALRGGEAPPASRGDAAGTPAAADPGLPRPAEPGDEAAADPAAAFEEAVRRSLRTAGGPPPASRAEAVASLLDAEAPLARRIAAARWLAARDDDAAFAALERAVASGEAPALLRAAVAEALGRSPHAAAPALLRALLEDAEPEVVAGAARGLVAEGTPEALDLVAEVLRDPGRSRAAREAAARALGTVDDPAARALLRELFARTGDESLAGAVLEGLAAQEDFASVEPFFRELLAAPGVDPERRLDAVEVLEEAGLEARPLLLETAAGAEDPALRSAAVDALVGAEDPDVVRGLVDLLPEEPDPQVRADLYAALAFDAEAAADTLEPGALLTRVTEEPAAPARLEGARLVAWLLAEPGGDALAPGFDRSLVPWLEDQARAGASRHARLTAVDALAVGATPGARDALHRLARGDDDAVARVADRALARLETVETDRP